MLSSSSMPHQRPYLPPRDVVKALLGEILPLSRPIPENQLGRLGFDDVEPGGLHLWCAGHLELLMQPCVAIVGTRDVSPEGAARARRLARELVKAGIVVVSGLAKGVDTNAHSSAIENGGRTIAVVGTPINKCYPAENSALQEEIYKNHLLISQFEPNSRVFQSNFPTRNRLMAAICDATVIIEASNSSGTKHQAAESQKLDRWLFFPKSMIDSDKAAWPTKFINPRQKRTMVFESSEQIVNSVMRNYL